MGTRHLIAVYINGEYKIAQYGQWDGYPEGQGLEVLDFLITQKTENNFERFKQKLKLVRFKTEADQKVFDAYSKSIGISETARFISLEQAQKIDTKFPFLSRDLGATILNKVNETEEPIWLVNSIDFAQDSLFCEFAYVIDFDTNKFEIYTGFRTTPSRKGRFKAIENNNGYYAIGLQQTYSLDKLPTKEKFFKDLKCTD